MLRKIRVELQREGLIKMITLPLASSFFCNSECQTVKEKGINLVPVIDSSYVDDGVFFIFCITPLDWQFAFSRSSSIIVFAFRRRGLRLNFKKGKSEVAIALRGRGSGTMRRKFSEDGHVL